MIFALVLTAIFLFMAVYALVFLSKRQKIFLLIAYAFAILVVWQPKFSHFIAHVFGIGRGLDLFLMLITVILANAVVILARHISLMHQQQTLLVREIALHRVFADEKAHTQAGPDAVSR